MFERLLTLIGARIDGAEIAALLAEFNVAPPKKTTVTPNNDAITIKLASVGIHLGFHLGLHHIDLKPIPAKRANVYVPMLRFLTFQPKRYRDPLPLGVRFDDTPEALTAKLGEPNVNTFVIVTTTWRAPLLDRYEMQVVECEGTKEFIVTLPWDPVLELPESYPS